MVNTISLLILYKSFSISKILLVFDRVFILFDIEFRLYCIICLYQKIEITISKINIILVNKNLLDLSIFLI